MIKKKLINQYDIKILEKFKSGAGFTLIELLVVMAIIGVLASLTLLNIPASLGRARDAQRKNDLKQIQNALGLYHQDNGRYPSTDWVNSTYGGAFWITDASGKNLTNQYIKKMPVDPLNKNCNISNGTNANPVQDNTPNCFEYAYYSWSSWCNLSGPGDGYILVTRLEQYQGTDFSQKTYYNPDGTVCNTWWTTPVSGIYVVSNP